MSVDNYESRHKRRLYSSKGRTPDHGMFCGGTIFHDHASNMIRTYHQYTLEDTETNHSKL